MKRIFVLVLLSVTLLVPVSGAEARHDPWTGQEHVDTHEVEFRSTDELLAQGWEQSGPEVWRKTLDNGFKAEITFGATAYERARGWLDARIEALRALENLNGEQELELFELLLRRQKLDRAVPTKGFTSSCGSSSCTLCKGTAYFTHDYGWLNTAYPYAKMQSRFTRSSSGGLATTYAYASICVGGTCYSDSDTDAGSDWILSALAESPSPPTWTCSASANGYVQSNAVGGGCTTLATYTADPWYCTP